MAAGFALVVASASNARVTGRGARFPRLPCAVRRPSKLSRGARSPAYQQIGLTEPGLRAGFRELHKLDASASPGLRPEASSSSTRARRVRRRPGPRATRQAARKTAGERVEVPLGVGEKVGDRQSRAVRCRERVGASPSGYENRWRWRSGRHVTGLLGCACGPGGGGPAPLVHARG